MTLSSAADLEVEWYLGFNENPQRTASTQQYDRYCSITPSRLKRTSQIDERHYHRSKRPSSTNDLLSGVVRTPVKGDVNQTPSKWINAKSLKKTPKRKTPLKIYSSDCGDRYIPYRNSMNIHASHHKMLKFDDCVEESSKNILDIRDQEIKMFEQKMSENLKEFSGVDLNTRKILQFQTSSKKTPKKVNKILCNSATSSKKKKPRSIPLTPERVLDAPSYIDDYYLNLLHWSKDVDLLAVALERSVYVWTPSTGGINHLCQLFDPDDYVTSVQWMEQGAHIAVGTASGCVQLWDCESKKRLRQMAGHLGRVGALSWKNHTLTSGSRSGAIHNHDVRIANHHVNTLSLHQQEVCGLQWSPNGRYLASGCNSNKVGVWDSNSEIPLYCFAQHQAAVKAIAWNPWEEHILATGGGSADGCIRLWTVNTGSCLQNIDTGSQVSSLLWNADHREIISSHGYPHNQLSIWEYPAMKKKVDLLGHTHRVLQMSVSPDATRVMSASGDETLRLWHCFQARPPSTVRRKLEPSLLSMASIR